MLTFRFLSPFKELPNIFVTPNLKVSVKLLSSDANFALIDSILNQLEGKNENFHHWLLPFCINRSIIIFVSVKLLLVWIWWWYQRFLLESHLGLQIGNSLWNLCDYLCEITSSDGRFLRYFACDLDIYDWVVSL